MSEQLLTVLKFAVLAVLYLFFLRVLRAVWVEVNGPKKLERAPAGGPAPAGAVGAPADKKPRRRGRRSTPQTVTVVQPEAQRGRSWPVDEEITIGRAAGCHISIDDTYASQLHTRVFSRDGQVWVEDLGSTNGTFVNRTKVTSATTVKRGDLIQIGNTVMELG